MYGKFKGNFISQRSNNGSDGKQYHYAKFNDGVGDLEVSTSEPLSLERFKEVVLTVDILQGKYPKFKLVQIG